MVYRKTTKGKRVSRIKEAGRRFFSNVPEDLAACVIDSVGLSFSKRGYPDFTVYRPDGSIYGFVEVKPNDDHPLKKEQVTFFEFCKEKGIPCIRWSPEEGETPLLNFVKGI